MGEVRFIVCMRCASFFGSLCDASFTNTNSLFFYIISSISISTKCGLERSGWIIWRNDEISNQADRHVLSPHISNQADRHVLSPLSGGMMISVTRLIGTFFRLISVTRLIGTFFRLTFNPASGWCSKRRWRLEAKGIGSEPRAKTGHSSQADTLGVSR